MLDPVQIPQVTVLDTGGQYCHLIARKVRELGIYADVRRSETPAKELAGRKALIISGGPDSVYDPGSPTVDPEIFHNGHGVLGICYGLHLMAQALGGDVRKGDKGEFGLATLEVERPGGLFAGLDARQQVWMSHRDTVMALPEGFSRLGSTDTCAFAAMAEPARKLYAVQFHPEVVHTVHGKQVLSNFLFSICGCERDWNPVHRIGQMEDEIRRAAGDRNVFFFVSGGVDSTVAFTLCLRALGDRRVRGVYVDTGLMREGETDFVRRTFDSLGSGTVAVERAEAHFLGALAGVADPEQKRHAIGEEFLRVQERVIADLGLLDGHWVLGQGTIYPDTIESGGSEKAATIKTHHNRVAGVQKLLEAGRLVEPLAAFYKDEVREIGRELGLPPALLERHPFPGPGLAIRCLCADREAAVERIAEGWIAPIRSVGVQGDSRSYAPVLVLAAGARHDEATELINRIRAVNRVVSVVESCAPVESLRVRPAWLSAERLHRLRRADAIVRRISEETGFEKRVWQFPVVMIPLGTEERPDAIVLRPVESVDGMTARSAVMDAALSQRLSGELMSLAGVGAVFFDLTHKPPATIEWE
ncbi:MAG: glutamine-hydrolyzing GMP synthase [Bryobacteraceae bacterium]